jgi:hypothetical protein
VRGRSNYLASTVYTLKGEGGPCVRLLLEEPSLAVVEDRSHSALLWEGPYWPRCGQPNRQGTQRTVWRRSKRKSGRKLQYLTLMNSICASLNNIRSVQVRCIFHALRKAWKKLPSVKSFCSSSLQTWSGSSFVTFAFGRCFKQR